MRPLLLLVLVLGADLLAQGTTREPAAVTIRGRVVTEARGEAVRGATVTPAGESAGDAVSTNARGDFEIRLTSRGRVDLRVTKAGFAAEALSVDVAQAGEPIEVDLIRGGAIVGRVQDGSGEARAGVPLTVTALEQSAGTDNARGLTASTNDLGEFRAGGLRPGRYRVAVQGGDSLGVNRPATAVPVAMVPESAIPPAQTIEVRAGEDARMLFEIGTPDTSRVTVVTLPNSSTPTVMITPAGFLGASTRPTTGVITGRIVDQFGDPLEGANVHLMQLAFAAGGGHRAEAPIAPRVTDDRGEFRLFAVNPGNYLLIVRLGGASSDMALYPGRGGFDQAVPLRVEAGQELGGIDMVFAPVRPAKVRGVVLNASGRAGLIGSIGAIARTPSGPLSLGAEVRITEDGTFELPGILPGTYSLYAGGKGESDIREFGVTEIAVGGDDLDSVVVTTSPGTRVAGTVTFEGAVTSSPPAAGLVVAATDPANTTSAYTGGFIRNGGFEMVGVVVPGLLALEGAPENWWLKSVLIAGREVVDTPTMFGLSHYDDVKVTIATGGGRVEGTIAREAGPFMSGMMSVVIYPADRSRWFYRSRYLRRVHPKAAQFSIGGVPPGEYLVAAIVSTTGATSYGDWQNPEFLDALAPVAERVELRDGQTAQVTLRMRSTTR